MVDIKVLWNEWERDEEIMYIKEKKDISIMARYRLGSEIRASKHWLSAKERECRLCNEKEETLEHIFEECRVSKVCKGIGFVLNEDGRGRGFMKGNTWKRNRKIHEETEQA